jgi:glycosyltransferase involved in cell wall biosynthesis
MTKVYTKFKKRITIIPGFVDTHNNETMSKKDRIILSICRLTENKGIDELLTISKEILQKHKNWKWKIIGTGELTSYVNNFISNSGCKEQYIFEPPVSHDLSNEYSAASIFSLTSKSDSLGMTLIEAISYNLPCISFDCETGPRHIIQHGVNGFLIPPNDISAYVNNLDLLICNEVLRIQMEKNNADTVGNYSRNAILLKWKELLSKINFE